MSWRTYIQKNYSQVHPFDIACLKVDKTRDKLNRNLNDYKLKRELRIKKRFSQVALHA